MIAAGLGYSTRMQVAASAEEAADRAMASLGGREPAAALVMATAAWGAGKLSELIGDVARRIDCPALAGATVDGMLIGRFEVSRVPALAVLVLAGVEAEAVLCEPLPGDEAGVAGAVAARLRGAVRAHDLVVAFADALALSPQRLLAGFARDLPGLALVGLGASEPAGDEPRVWVGDEIGRRACATLVVRPLQAPRIHVTTGCRTRGRERRVTRSSGSWVLGLDGRRALEVLRAVQPVEGRPLTRELLVCLASGEPDRPPVLRNIVGVDERRGGFALPEPVPVDARIAFSIPDPAFARRDLREQAAAAARPGTALALHLSCQTRGATLFGAPGAEGGILADALGDVPLLGLMGAYQLAPAGRGVGQLHTYSGVLTLLDQ
ncbi:MAG: FIST C-terminal domain-containing protein [Deltaproteobacteria bacterium]|nr:FIST C-terminal domain-containing protein [Deltaproteobacteria bacterium]